MTMEASQVFHHCMRRAIVRSANRKASSFTRSYISNSQCQYNPVSKSASRTFTSTSLTRQDQKNQSQSTGENASNSDERGAVSEPSRRIDSRPQRTQSSQRSDARQIDLSSIPGIPSEYVAPKRPIEARSAPAKMSALFASANRNQPPPPRTTFSDTLGDRINDEELKTLDEKYPQTQKRRQFDGSKEATLGIVANIESKPVNLALGGAKLPLRLRPTLGRTQAVNQSAGFDLTRAFRNLDLKCRLNNVRLDEISQKYHTRRGQARKIKNRQRWRILFKEGFLNECARIRRMKRQGW